MNVSSHDLAAALAERLNEVAPGGLSVRSAGASIEVVSGAQAVGGSPALEIIDENDDRSLQDRVETATRAVLSGVQDVIIENIREPWPGGSGSRGDVPEPDCRIVKQELLIWFGDETDPALTLPAVSLA
jgi:hypothetical protein